MDAIAGTWVFAGADGVSGLWGLHGGALPLQTTPPKAGGPLETWSLGAVRLSRDNILSTVTFVKIWQLSF
jgi:hypothetical protein